jgi:hypothetical protein
VKSEPSCATATACGMLTRASVPDDERNRASDSAESPWYVFNDFGVRNVPEQEALSFPDTWKVCSSLQLLAGKSLMFLTTPQVPAIIYLERVDMDEQLDLSQLQSRIDERILGRDTNIAMSVTNFVACCGGSGSLIFDADIVTRRSSSTSCSKRMRCRDRTLWLRSTRSSCSCSRCVAL